MSVFWFCWWAGAGLLCPRGAEKLYATCPPSFGVALRFLCPTSSQNPAPGSCQNLVTLSSTLRVYLWAVAGLFGNWGSDNSATVSSPNDANVWTLRHLAMH